jgi:hypothetical protein
MKRVKMLWQRIYRSYQLSNLSVIEWIVVIALGSWTVQWFIGTMTQSWL